MVEPTQVLLPGQAIVSMRSDSRPLTLGEAVYSGIFIDKKGNIKQVTDDFGLFDFAYYLSKEQSVHELVNNKARVRKNDYLITGFGEAGFHVLCSVFQSRKEWGEKGMYQQTLRGGRIDII